MRKFQTLRISEDSLEISHDSKFKEFEKRGIGLKSVTEVCRKVNIQNWLCHLIRGLPTRVARVVYTYEGDPEYCLHEDISQSVVSLSPFEQFSTIMLCRQPLDLLLIHHHDKLLMSQ
jgi:hypothetical protein